MIMYYNGWNPIQVSASWFYELNDKYGDSSYGSDRYWLVPGTYEGD